MQGVFLCFFIENGYNKNNLESAYKGQCCPGDTDSKDKKEKGECGPYGEKSF